MYIEWEPSFNVGVELMDKQHQYLIQLLNALYQAVGPDTDASVIWTHLLAFSSYADTHFEDEERLAKLAGVDQRSTEAHAHVHASYKARIRKFGGRLARHDHGVGMELLAFLTDWWVKHIQKEDRHLAQLILAQKR